MNRKDHWENVYRTRSPDEVSWYQVEPVISLELISAAGIGADSAIIDVGGGASALTERLLDRGFTDLTVLDISSAALEHARRRLAARADAIKWIEADVTEFTPGRSYSLWHDRAVFHFLTDAADRRKYVAALRAGLAPGGHLIIATFAIGGPERCSGLDIVQYDANRLLQELGTDFRLADQRIEHHITPGGGEQKFAWFHAIRIPAAQS